jgi:putative tricarboxylic transport membrane protein
LVGALLVALGAAISVRGLVVDGPPVPQIHARPLLVSLAAVVLFGLALQFVGLVAAIVVLVGVGAFAARDVRLTETVALAAFLTLFSVAVFVWLLGLPLPLWQGR